MTTNAATPEPQRRHESPDIGAAAARLIRALVVRAAEADHEALEQLYVLEQLASDATQLAGHELHDRAGYSYGWIGSALGISRQAALKRFGRRPSPTTMAWLTRGISSAHLLRDAVDRLTGPVPPLEVGTILAGRVAANRKRKP